MTANGRSCQPWSSQWPHVHDWFKNDDEFPNDKSVHAAKNYCRDPDLEGRTWCYTMDAQFRWEYCNFPPCYGEYGGRTWICNTSAFALGIWHFFQLAIMSMKVEIDDVLQ